MKCSNKEILSHTFSRKDIQWHHWNGHLPDWMEHRCHKTNIRKERWQEMSSQLQRNLTLTSCLGKLFTSVLQNRLNKFIEQHNIFNPEQFGFRPNARTTDSLFILRKLLHKYTKQHKMLVSLNTKKLLIVYGNSVWSRNYTNTEFKENSWIP